MDKELLIEYMTPYAEFVEENTITEDDLSKEEISQLKEIYKKVK